MPRRMSFAAATLASGTAFLCLQPIVGFAQDSAFRERVLDCRRHSQESARLACFDELADELADNVTDDPSSSPTMVDGRQEAPANAPAANSTATLRRPADEVPTTLAVRIVECRRLPDNDYLFKLDNGEYWRQNGGYRLRLRDCQFDATLEKDFFGYKLEFAHNGQKVRVKHVQ